MPLSKRLTFLAVSAVALCAGSPSVGSSPGSPIASYHGGMTHPTEEGTIEVYYRSRSNKVTVVVRNVALRCDTGIAYGPEYSFRGEATERGRFLIQDYHSGLGNRAYSEVKGRITEDRASGTFYRLSDSYNPDAAPDCATPRPEPWSAKRRN